VQAPDLEAHLLAQVGIEIRQGLVEEQRLGLHHERPGERHALLLAAGQLARIAVGECLEPRHREDRIDALDDLGFRQLPEGESVADVLAHVHVRPERIALEDHRHPASLRRIGDARRRHGASPDPDLTAIRHDEAGDQAQRGGLAAAGRAKQADEATPLHREVNGVHYGERTYIVW
jgi:hypothetical protein